MYLLTGPLAVIPLDGGPGPRIRFGKLERPSLVTPLRDHPYPGPFREDVLLILGQLSLWSFL